MTVSRFNILSLNVLSPKVWLALAIFLNVSGVTDFYSSFRTIEPLLRSVEGLVFLGALFVTVFGLFVPITKDETKIDPVIGVLGFGILAAPVVSSFVLGHDLAVLDHYGFRHFAKFIVVVTLCLALSSSPATKRVAAHSAFAGLVAMAVVILIRYLVFQEVHPESGRMDLDFRHGDPNFACTFMTIGFVWAIQKISSTSSTILRATWALTGLLFAITAWFTESRFGLAVFVLSAMGSLAIFPLPIPRRVLFPTAIAAGIFAVGLFGERLIDRYSNIDDASNEGRWAGLLASADMFVESPVFGSGIESSQRFVQPYLHPLFVSERTPLEIHATFMQILGELGLLGLAAYLALYLTVLIQSWRLLKVPQAKGTAKIAILIAFVILANMLSVPFAYIGTVHGLALIAIALPQAFASKPAA